MSSKKGFTLLEIIVTVTIIAILVALVVPQILQRARKAEEAEALVNLGAIRRAQLDLHGISGRFVEAADEKGIQAALGLSISNLIYDFKIIDADEDNFLGVATPVDALESWLEEIKIDKDGFVGYSGYGDGGDGSGGGSSSEGSDSGGGSGGGGGGSSGGGRSGSTGGTGVTGTGKTPDSIIVSSETSAPPFTGYADDIKEALDILLLMTDELESEGAVTGKFLAEFAAVNQISISFASETPCGDGAAGCHQGYAFNGTIASVITVLDTYKDNIYAAAAITAHEILHAVWHKDYYEYYFGQKPAPVVGMPIPGGGVRHSYSEDHEYNTKKTGGEIWNQLKQSYKNVYDSKNLWRQPDYDAMYFVGVTEDVAKGYLNSIYGYDFEYKY